MQHVPAKLAAAAISLAVAISAGQASAATTTNAAKVRSPESIACSKQADAKNLHGAERKAFRSTCMKDAKASPQSGQKATEKKS